MDLEAILKAMRPLTAAATMKYIHERDAEVDALDPKGPYSQRLFTALTTIRDNSANDNMKEYRVKMKGTIRPADSMCLFVCGLLASPSMSFGAWVASPEEAKYADAFFDYMIAMLGATITVRQTELVASDPDAQTLALQAIQDDDTPVSASCFICAHNNSPKNTEHDNILVLDAFSSPGLFMKYDPAVWHLHCLWLSRTDDTMRCYAARTAKVSYIFIGNYADHVRTLKAKQTTMQPEAVLEMVTKPLEMYKRSLLSLTSPKPAAVISRSWHQVEFNLYMPLVYVHLLVRPDAPLYADVYFNDLLEGMLAYAVGHTQKSLLQTLPYTADKDNPFTCKLDPILSPAAYKSLTASHYDLMIANTFVIPASAQEKHILFAGGDLTQAAPTHCDYIDAICQVRYNWVFDKTIFQSDYALPPMPPNPPYHTIDVHRHICHLQKSQPPLANLFATLRTGSHVIATAGALRTGVVVFDVPAVGRIAQHFTGFNATNHDFAQTCQFFGFKSASANRAVLDAMLQYFTPKTRWSLCDMSFKYVMYNADANTYFMQDSSQLMVDRAKPVLADTFDACPFCPVCFVSPDTATTQDGSMSAHLATHADYPVAPLTVAAAAPVRVAALQPLPPPVLDPEEVPSGSDRSGGSAPPAVAAADPLPLPAPEAEKKATQQHLEEMDMLIKQFKFRTSQKEINAVRTQAETSDKNYDNLQQRFDTLLKLVDKQALESTTLATQIEDSLVSLSVLFKQHHDELNEATNGNDSLADQLAEANAKHEQNMKEALQQLSEQHEEAIDKVMRTHLALMEDTKKQEDELGQLLETIRKIEEERKNRIIDLEALNQQVLQKNADIAALQAEVARLQALAAQWKAYSDPTINALQVEINALRQENALLRQGLPPAPNAAPAHDPADAAALLLAQQALLAAQEEVAKYRDYIAVLQGEIDALRAQIAAMHQNLKDAAATNRAGFKQLRQVISANVQKQIGVGNMFDKLYPKPPLKPQYTAIRDAVAARANNPQTAYTPAAAFLILESMGGTWCEYLRNESAAQTDPKRNARRALVLEMLLYDLTMWFSIAGPKHTRYASAHVTAFITAFKLDSLEITDPNADASSDDDAPPASQQTDAAQWKAEADKIRADMAAEAARRQAELDAVFPE